MKERPWVRPRSIGRTRESGVAGATEGRGPAEAGDAVARGWFMGGLISQVERKARQGNEPWAYIIVVTEELRVGDLITFDVMSQRSIERLPCRVHSKLQRISLLPTHEGGVASDNLTDVQL
jgi:hypothetical protein